MARSRILKPGFFKNEDLGDLPPLTRLLFAGIWTIADRDGRLEDRPRKIKADLLAYDEGDGEEMVAALVAKGFLIRYEVNGVRYLQVVNWKNHQQPHIKEQASTIPAPEMHVSSTVQAPDMHGASTGDAPEMHVSSTEHARLVTSYSLPVKTMPERVSKPPTRAREEVFSPVSPMLAATDLEADATACGTTPEIYAGYIAQWADSRQSKGKASADWRADLRTFVRAAMEITANQSNGARASPVTFEAQKAANTDDAFAQVRTIVEGSSRNGVSRVRGADAPPRRVLPG